MRNVERAREVRLWIGQIIIPAIGVGIFIYSNPNSRRWVKDKVESVKSKFRK